MRQLLRATAAALCALSLTACATTMSVGSHVGRGVDFARYRTYDWGPADDLPTGDPRLDRNPFFQDHLQGAVEQQLAARGFERSVSGIPDLLVHYHASIDQRFDVHDVDRRYGHCLGDDCQPEVTTYEAGTLVLDIVDTRIERRDLARLGPGQRGRRARQTRTGWRDRSTRPSERMLARLRPGQRG